MKKKNKNKKSIFIGGNVNTPSVIKSNFTIINPTVDSEQHGDYYQKVNNSIKIKQEQQIQLNNSLNGVRGGKQKTRRKFNNKSRKFNNKSRKFN